MSIASRSRRSASPPLIAALHSERQFGKVCCIRQIARFVWRSYVTSLPPFLEWLMSTAIHEPPPSIRVGRLVSVSGKPRQPKAPPPAAEPSAPKSDEVRLLLYLALGGASCLIALALAGMLLIANENALAEEAAATPPGLIAAIVPAPELPQPMAPPMIQPALSFEGPE